MKREVRPLTVSLNDPGMTPYLRCGVGGLAASLRAIARRSKVKWALKGLVRVPLGPGFAVVDAQSVRFEWGDAPKKVLEALIEGSFRLSKDDLIELPGVLGEHGATAVLLAALQEGLKRTILQHGKSTTKKGGLRTASVEIDDRSYPLQYQPQSGFLHLNKGVGQLLMALESGAVRLAGWAYPGAADRHSALKDTRMAYGPALAVAALFAIVGTLSLLARSRSGVMVVLAPRDLLLFGALRSEFTPKTYADANVAGANDALLSVSVALRRRHFELAKATQSVEASVLRATPWDKKQKYRVSVARASRQLSDDDVNLYEKTLKALSTQLIPLEKAQKNETGFFASAGVLREFVAANLAQGRAWYTGFATARAGGDRFIHYLRSTKNKGALNAREREGLHVLIESLEEAERILVKSVHVAIRQRFGAIAAETSGMPATRKRWDNERERWRLAFAQAKTHEQVRAALADLWSRAGSNSELKANWEKLLPLLRESSWQAARDLALVALASYRGAGGEQEAETSKEEE